MPKNRRKQRTNPTKGANNWQTKSGKRRYENRSAGRKLDLHGRNRNRAIEEFVEFYNKQINTGDLVAISVIHGHGSTGKGGVIRILLRKLLGYYTGYLNFILGEEWDGNPGHTVVIPRLPLPTLEEGWDRKLGHMRMQPRSPLGTPEDVLMEAIVQYCGIPRTSKQIIEQFTACAGSSTISSMIEQLEMLTRIWKITEKSRPMYLAM